MLSYVTTNDGKLREAREYLDGVADVTRANYDYVEVQSDDLETIAAAGARDAYRELGEPVLVDDAGLFLDAFDGFPGPYSAYVEDRLGIERVHDLVEPEENRRAAFRCVLAYAEGPAASGSTDRTTASTGDTDDAEPVLVETFAGSVQGQIVAPRGDGGFGYDPIFEHGGRTFAEMSTEEKNALSHRGRALAAFADWLADREQ